MPPCNETPAVLLGLTFAARCAKLDWRALSLSLTPLAGLLLPLALLGTIWVMTLW